jgi:hypothetical protein
MKTLLLAAMLLIWTPVHLSAQEELGKAHFAHLTVTSNVDGAVVYVDSVSIGTIPLKDYPVAVGAHRVCVAVPHERSWHRSTICTDIAATADTVIGLVLNFPHTLQITSTPYGATILFGDSIVGETPMFLDSDVQRGIITLHKEGFESKLVPFDSSTSIMNVMLVPRGTGMDRRTVDYLARGDSENLLPVVVAGASAVVSGAVAAYFKLRADNFYGDYQRTGDGGTLERVKRLDVASGISLAVSQINLAMLTYFLLSQ